MNGPQHQLLSPAPSCISLSSLRTHNRPRGSLTQLYARMGEIRVVTDDVRDAIAGISNVRNGPVEHIK